MNVFQIAWRNIQRNRRRSLLSVLAVLLVSTVLVVGFSVLEGVKRDTIYNSQSFTSGSLRIINPLYEKNKSLSPLHLNLPGARDRTLWAESQVGVDGVAPRIMFGSSITRGEKLYLAQGWGADLAREEKFSKISSYLVEGRLPASGEGVKEAAMGYLLAKSLGIKVGDKFTFLTATVTSTNMVTLKVVGIMNFPVGPMNQRLFIIPLDRAQYFLRMDDAVLEILVKTKSGVNPDTLAATWNGELKTTGLEAQSWTQASLVYTMTQFVDIIFTIIGVLFILLGSAVVVNTTMMVIFERKKEIGTLTALGMSEGSLVLLFLVEAAYLAFFGTTIGVIFGSGIAGILSVVGVDFSGISQGIDMEFPSVMHPLLNLRSVVATWGMIFSLSVFASLIPSTMVTRLDPIEALRD